MDPKTLKLLNLVLAIDIGIDYEYPVSRYPIDVESRNYYHIGTISIENINNINMFLAIP